MTILSSPMVLTLGRDAFSGPVFLPPVNPLSRKPTVGDDPMLAAPAVVRGMLPGLVEKTLFMLEMLCPRLSIELLPSPLLGVVVVLGGQI